MTLGNQMPVSRKVHEHQQQSSRAPVELGVVGIPPVAAATNVPTKMPAQIKSTDIINDMHICYALAHP